MTRPSAIVLLVVAAWLVLGLPWLSGAVTIPWDAKAHFYPQLQFLAQSLHRGESPAWTPFVFAGWPQVADPQSLIFSPIFLALAAVHPDPGFQAADGAVLAALLVGALALVLWFRDQGWSGAGALVAALAFAFGASAAWRLQHVGQVGSLALWPVAHLFLTRALGRRSLLNGAAAGLAAALLALGRDQVAMLGLWTLAIVAAGHFFREPRAALGPLLIGALVGAVTLAAPLTLTALLAEVSNRPSIDYEGAAKGSLHPALLLTAVIPNLYGADGPLMQHWGPPSPLWGPADLFLARNMGQLYLGALPVALLALGLTRRVLLDREIRLLTAAFILMLLYALGRATPLFGLLFQLVPGVDLFRRPADATFLVGGIGAVLAGYVAHRWWDGTLPRASARGRKLELVLLAIPFMVSLAVALAKGTFGLAWRPLLTSLAFMGIAVAILAYPPSRGRGSLVLAALTVFLVLDLRVNNGPNESTGLPPAIYDVLRPGSQDPVILALRERLGDGLDRVELAGLGFHWPNASLVHRLHHTLGYNPLRLALYARATGAEDHVALPEQRRFSALMPSYRSTLADLLGLRFIVTGAPVEAIDPALRPGDLVPLGRVGSAHLYENPRALPRARLVGETQGADFAAILATGRWPEVDHARTVLLETASQPSGVPATGQARIVAYGTTRIVVEVEASAPAHLVLADPFHPWWEAQVNGACAPILRADVLFRAVAVPAGRSTVRFAFHPLAGAWRQLTEQRSGQASPPGCPNG